MGKTILFFSLLICLLLPFNSFSELNDSTSNYYSYVNRANYHASMNNLDSSSFLFKEAFKVKKNPFTMDLNNSIVVEINKPIPDTNFITSNLKKLILKGARMSKIFKKVDVKYYCSLIDTNQNTNKYLFIDSIVKATALADQSIRKYAYSKYSVPYPTELYDSIISSDKHNIEIVKKIFCLKDFNEDYIMNCQEEVKLIIQHVRGTDFDPLRKLILELIHLGKIDVRQFILLLDEDCFQIYNSEIDNKVSEYKNWKIINDCDQALGIFGTGYVDIFENTIVLSELDESKLEKINKVRTKVFLNNLYEDAKIISFAYFGILKGFKYYIPVIFPDNGLSAKVIESLKRQNKRTIIFRGKEDFDINRKF